MRRETANGTTRDGGHRFCLPDWESWIAMSIVVRRSEVRDLYPGPYLVGLGTEAVRSEIGEVYAEYGWAMRNPDSKQWAFHRRCMARTRTIELRELFKAGMFDQINGRVFLLALSTHVTLTSKHHDVLPVAKFPQRGME